MRKARSLLLSALPLLAFSGIASATGYFSHGYGVRAHGIAGVGIALPQDGLAAAINPAGTARMDDRLDLGLTWVSPRSGTTITSPNPVAGDYDGSGKKNFFVPELGYIRHLSSGPTLGLAIYGNGGMNTTYENGIPLFGTGKTGARVEQLFVSPSVAWRLGDNQAFGAALNFAYQRFKAEGLSNLTATPPSVSPANVTDRGLDSSTGVGLRLGWSGQLAPALTLGATWSSKVHTGNLDKYKGLLAGNGSFDIPENYGVGIAYKLTPALTLAADVQEIKYGNVKSIANPLTQLFAGNLLGSADGPGFGWRNITVVKIGGIYDYSKDLTLRAGVSHSKNPVPASETFLNILAPAVMQDYFTFGATWKTLGGDELSVSCEHAFKKTVNGVGSIPAPFGGGEANVHLGTNIFGIAYTWKL